MKKAIAVIIIPMLILSFSGLSSCKNKAEKKEKDQKSKIELDQVESLGSEIEKNVYPLPTSAEVIKMLSDLEVGYILGITNPVENARKYLTSSSKAANMGVYGADLSYATLYNIQQEVINFLDAIRSLANELNMSKIYDESLYDKIKLNFDNRDELVKILTEAFNNTYAYLSENEQQTLALLVVGGAWVEGMYLTTHVSEAAYQVAGISKVLIEQKESFDIFMDITKPYLEEQTIKDFVNKLEPIKKVYDGLTTSLTNQNIIDITAAIEKVRGQII
ncbi:MAG TPA: hypothetical protein DEO60_13495 [Bacteroidales bacterium]|nr:hypothetical protein [Bacteroidales bacterium]HBZ22140.1 hypothetical protein [Bacteroidales bacterium]